MSVWATTSLTPTVADRRTRSSGLALAIGLSVAAHIAAGGYIYSMRFATMPEPRIEESAPIDVEWLRRDRAPDPAPRETSPAPRNTSATHVPPDPVDSTRIDVSPFPAPETAGETVDAMDPNPFGVDPGTAAVAVEIADPAPRVIRNPDWRVKPTGAQLAGAYPDSAARRSLAGRATLNCTVDRSGRLGECRVESETPAGEGFGAAAMKLRRHFQLTPRTVDGEAVDGASVRIPIVFRPSED